MASANDFSRRRLLAGAGGIAAASMVAAGPAAGATRKRRYAVIGTGWRGSGMWGTDLVKRYADVLDFVGLCDINPKRAEAARKRMGVSCPTFTSFDEMCDRA